MAFALNFVASVPGFFSPFELFNFILLLVFLQECVDYFSKWRRPFPRTLILRLVFLFGHQMQLALHHQRPDFFDVLFLLPQIVLRVSLMRMEDVDCLSQPNFFHEFVFALNLINVVTANTFFFFGGGNQRV